MEWEGRSEHRAGDLLRIPSEENGPRGEAKDFLRDLLEVKPLPAKAVFAKAREAGHSERTIKRAKAELGAISIKSGFGEATCWLWSLPGEGGHGDPEGGQENPKEAKGAKGASPGTLGALGGDSSPEEDSPDPRTTKGATVAPCPEDWPPSQNVAPFGESGPLRADGRSPSPSPADRCTVCAFPLDPVLAAHGDTTHPTCADAA